MLTRCPQQLLDPKRALRGGEPKPVDELGLLVWPQEQVDRGEAPIEAFTPGDAWPRMCANDSSGQCHRYSA